jgi:hypothetical protein
LSSGGTDIFLLTAKITRHKIESPPYWVAPTHTAKMLLGHAKGAFVQLFVEPQLWRKHMFDDSCFTNEITDFRKLRTGKKRLKVVVVDENRHILFIARVFQNRPSTTGRLRFDNKKYFDLQSRTIENQKVSLFLWGEDLERRWLWQSEIENISRWLEIARPEDIIVFGGFIAEESGCSQVWNHPSVAVLAKQEIMKRLPELGFVQLQRLAGMLCSEPIRMAA